MLPSSAVAFISSKDVGANGGRVALDDLIGAALEAAIAPLDAALPHAATQALHRHLLQHRNKSRLR